VIDTHHFDRHGVLLSDADPAGSGSASLLVACCELFSRNPAILGFDLHSNHGDFVGDLDRHAA
jgi:hypothetical protein